MGHPAFVRERETAGPSGALLMTQVRGPRFSAAPTALRSFRDWSPALPGWADFWYRPGTWLTEQTGHMVDTFVPTAKACKKATWPGERVAWWTSGRSLCRSMRAVSGRWRRCAGFTRSRGRAAISG